MASINNNNNNIDSSLNIGNIVRFFFFSDVGQICPGYLSDYLWFSGARGE